MKFFSHYYQNVNQPDTSSKLLCAYFENLNDVMIDIKTMLKKSKTGQTKTMRKNVGNLQRFLEIGKFNHSYLLAHPFSC